MATKIQKLACLFVVAVSGVLLTFCQAGYGSDRDTDSGNPRASEQSASNDQSAKEGNVNPSAANGNAANGQRAVGFSFEIAKPHATKVSIFFVDSPESVRTWSREKLVPTLVEQLPQLVDLLATDGFNPPSECRVIFKRGDGVAYTSGTTIVCFTPWFEQNLDGEALGAFVHELTHWVQQYPGGAPSWLVEGLTDYIRWYKFEPKPIVHIDFRRANYTDSYRTTAAFLNYLILNVDPQIIQKLNALLRSGTYTDDAWSRITGKTAEQLWAEFRKSELEAKRAH